MNTPTPDPVPYAQHEREVLEVIDERDRAEEFADRLAEAVSALLGVPIGEHSSMNNPWQSALDAATAHLTALKPAVRPVEPSAVPVEGSGHPRFVAGDPVPFTAAELRAAGVEPGSVVTAEIANRIRPILSVDIERDYPPFTREGATTNEH